jgi:hypothetical protein
MTQREIDDDWQLVLCHRTPVLALVQQRALESGAHLRFDRAKLIDRYTETHDIRQLAHEFAVTNGALQDAPARLVRFAREFEHQTLVGAAGVGCRFVLLVPVTTRQRAEELSYTLERLGFDAAIEELGGDD